MARDRDTGDEAERLRGETETERLDRNWQDILQELRVTLTGTQIIAAFLLAIAFQPRFSELASGQVVLYLVLVALAATSTILALAPVVLHRMLFQRLVKEHVVRIGDRYLVASLVVTSLLVVGVPCLIFEVVLGDAAGIVAGVVAGVVVIALWAGMGWMRRQARSRS